LSTITINGELRCMGVAPLQKVLIVDDDDGMRRAVVRGLVGEFDVTDVDDGDAAIRVLEEGVVFDVIVTDLNMKRVGGDALVTWLNAHRPAMATRVLVMSGGSTDLTRVAWLRAFDATRLVHKPFALPDLVDAIRRVALR
jgi:DNA-binding NtrC family response regulator